MFPGKINAGKIERGAIFVVVIIMLLLFTAYMMVGGELPTTLPGPNNNLVAVQEPEAVDPQNSLQLYTFKGITLTPYPTLQQSEPVEEIPSSTVECGTTLTNTKPQIIWGYRIAQTPASGNQPAFQLFYTDAYAMPLGTTQMKQHPTDHITNPPISINLKDANGFTISPALYLTDLSTNAGDKSGDAQTDGVPQPPTDVYGAWKIENGVQPNTENGILLGTGADQWPPANGPAGGGDPTWTAEIVWNLASLKTKTGTALEKGKAYRLQAALHNGDATPKVSEICITFTMP